MFAVTVKHATTAHNDRRAIQNTLKQFDARAFYARAGLPGSALDELEMLIPDALFPKFCEMAQRMMLAQGREHNTEYSIYGYSVHLFYHEDGEA